MIRHLKDASLSHAVIFYNSEPKISFNGRYYASSEVVWFTVIRNSGILTLTYLEKGRRGNHLARLSTATEVSKESYDTLLNSNPVEFMKSPTHRYLWVDTAFYEAEIDLSLEEAAALVRVEEIKRSRKIQRAIEVSQGGPKYVRVNRGAIPDEVKHFIWTRDSGSCVSCGSKSDLQFDHVIPLALGGSNEVGNLQLLCATCNRQKGSSLTVQHLPRGAKGPQRLPSQVNQSVSPRASLPSSYLPGPNYSLHPSCPKVEATKVGGERAPAYASAHIRQLSNKGPEITNLYNEQLSTVRRICEELANYCNRFESLSVSVDWTAMTVRFGGQVHDPKKKAKFDSQAQSFVDCLTAAVLAWSELGQVEIPKHTEKVKEITTRINSAPSPDLADGHRRVAYWVEVLNDLLNEVSAVEAAVANKKYREFKKQLEKRAKETRKFCDRNLELRNPTTDSDALVRFDAEDQLISELKNLLETKEQRPADKPASVVEAAVREKGIAVAQPATRLKPVPPQGKYWKYTYLVLEIEYQFEPLKAQIGEYLIGDVIPIGVPITNPVEFCNARLEEMSRFYKEVGKHFNAEKLKVALGPPGGPADARLIREFVAENISVVLPFLESANALRRANVSSDWTTIYSVLSNLPRQALTNLATMFENFCETLTKRIEESEAGKTSSVPIEWNWKTNADRDRRAIDIATKLIKLRSNI